MWKKVLYYSTSAILSVVFMIAAFYTGVTNRFTSITEKAIKDNDLTNITRIFSSFSNKEPIYSATLNDGASVKIYETASVRNKVFDGVSSNYLDIVYSVYIINGNIIMTDSQDENGKMYNKSGFEISNSTENFTYLVASSGDYTNYTDIVTNAGDLNIFQIELQYSFVNSKIGSNINTIKIKNSNGSDYAIIEGINFNYNSVFFTKVSTLMVSFNDPSLSDAEKKAEYKKWEEDFRLNESYVLGYNSSEIYNIGFWLKLVFTFIAIITIILVVGDILVGNKKVVILFNSIFKGKNKG